MVEDTSTNGTFINGVRIGKNKIQPLKIGDHLALSVVHHHTVPETPEAADLPRHMQGLEYVRRCAAQRTC